MQEKIAFAMCGSFCTFETVLTEAEAMTVDGMRLLPVMSAAAAGMDTRFGTAVSFRERFARIAERPVITDLAAAEPLGPQRLASALLIAPCTGNTLGKLANGITDTPVTMAAKSMLRIGCPVILAISTNDGLAGAFQNIGRLMNVKNIYFVPFGQDDPLHKPTSLQADFTLLQSAVESALRARQLQPVLLT